MANLKYCDEDYDLYFYFDGDKNLVISVYKNNDTLEGATISLDIETAKVFLSNLKKDIKIVESHD